METMPTRNTKNRIGLLIDTARVELVLIQKHGSSVGVVVAPEEFEQLSAQSQHMDKERNGLNEASKRAQ